jgi:hypothetical protein
MRPIMPLTGRRLPNQRPRLRPRDVERFGPTVPGARAPPAPSASCTTPFFGLITRQAIRRGTFANVNELIAAIRRFIDAYNDRCEPFKWTKTADQILTKASRPKTSDTRH